MIPVDWTSFFESAHARPGVPGSGQAALLGNTRAVRIDWGDCDPAGIIFYPRYFDIFDACTSALFEKALGLSKRDLLKTYNIADFPLVHTRARFLRPTRYGDDVTVETTITFGHASFELEHRLSLTGQACVECLEKRVWSVRDPNGSFRSRLVPEEVLKKFRV